MPITVTVNGSNYTLNQAGDNPPWGDNQAQLLQALVNVANSTVGIGDITNTSFTISNNITSVTNVTGLAFDPTVVRSAVVRYSIYRSSNTPNELSECGQLLVTYKSTASTWELSQVNVGSSGVTFSITNGGQIQYISSDIGSGAYVGKMKFSATAFTQT